MHVRALPSAAVLIVSALATVACSTTTKPDSTATAAISASPSGGSLAAGSGAHAAATPAATPAAGKASGSSTCSSTGTAIPPGIYAGPIHANLTTTMHLDVGGQNIPNAGGSTTPFNGNITVKSNGLTVTGTLTLSYIGTAQVGLPGDRNVHSVDGGTLDASISGPATNPVVDGTVSGVWGSFDAPVINGNGDTDSPIHTGLHITRSDCTQITGDLIALFQQFAAPVTQYLTLGGTGTWTAQRT
jgi:hypothetical protein